MPKLLILLSLLLTGCASAGFRQYTDNIRTQRDNALVPEDAPLASAEWQTSKFKADFVAKNCASRDKDCDTKYQDEMTRKMDAIYFMADKRGVIQKCALERCAGPEDFERRLRASHNEQVNLWYKEAYAKGETIEHSNDAAAYAQMGQALQRGVAQQQNETRHCTSTPNVFGGFNTSCD